MSSLLTRILLSVVMVPLASVMYIVIVILIDQRVLDGFGFLFADIIVSMFVIIYWIMLWRQSVRWTRWRIIWTVLSWFSAIGLSMAIGLILTWQFWWHAWPHFIFLAGIMAIPVWLLITLLLWRETPAERVERIRQSAGKTLFCPQCGYNMTGLYEARCPECGSQYTLDQLMAGQELNRIRDLAEYSSTQQA